jgi:hypothetical protein
LLDTLLSVGSGSLVWSIMGSSGGILLLTLLFIPTGQ